MEPIVVVEMAVFASLPVVYALRRWRRGRSRRELRRALRKARHASIADAPEGEAVRLDGRVADGETLIAPLTGRRCVFYVATIEENVDPRGGWIERVRETRGVRFTVDDSTGRLIVDPAQAQIDVDIDRTSHSGFLDNPTPAEAGFLERHKLQPSGRYFNRRFRYCEGVFEIGEPIAVMCYPIREPDPDAVSRTFVGYRELAPTRLRVGGSSEHPILLSDAPTLTGARPH